MTPTRILAAAFAPALAAALGAALLLPHAASAQPAPGPGGYSVVVGAGLALAPDYEGSDEARLLPLLTFRAERDGFVVESERVGLRADLLPSRSLVLGPILRWEPGRSRVRDDVVDRLPDVDGGLGVGLQAGYVFGGFGARDSLRVGIDFVQEVAGGHGGLLATPSVTWSAPATDALRLSVRASATWASEDYMDAFFTVGPAGAARSGLRRFDAGAGVKDAGLGLLATYSLTPSVVLTGVAAYARLLGDAADSPVVADRGSADQLFLGAAVGYRF